MRQFVPSDIRYNAVLHQHNSIELPVHDIGPFADWDKQLHYYNHLKKYHARLSRDACNLLGVKHPHVVQLSNQQQHLLFASVPQKD